MKTFPNKVIAKTYENAKGKIFHKRTNDLTYIDQDGSMDYNHVALNWLEDQGILGRNLSNEKWVFEYKIVK